LIPGHRYLFKVPVEWKTHQVWSEVIAARLAEVVGADVPRCFVGQDADGQVGALIEFFYGYPSQVEVPRFVHASDLLGKTITDSKKGRPHSLRRNISICRRLRIPDVIDWWGKTILFDALIGNTDRHPDNWGVLVHRLPTHQLKYSLAPAFDNGTSLGYEVLDKNLRPEWDVKRLRAYINRGTHHCGWNRSEGIGRGHIDLCRIFAETFPETGAIIRDMLGFPGDRLGEVWPECMGASAPRPFTEARLAFVVALLEGRRAALRAAIGA